MNKAPRLYKNLCSTQLSMKFMLINFKNGNNCWHFNIYQHDNTSESLKIRKIFIFQHISFNEQLKFHAESS